MNYHAPIELRKYRVTQAFGVENPAYSILKHHPGDDYGTQGEDNVNSYFVCDAVVTDVGAWQKSLGNYIFYYNAVVDKTFAVFHHRDPLRYKVGDIVTAGSVIGIVGQTGFSQGIHCHIECLKGKHNFYTRAAATKDWATFSLIAESPDALIRPYVVNPQLQSDIEIEQLLDKIDTIHLIREAFSRKDGKLVALQELQKTL